MQGARVAAAGQRAAGEAQAQQAEYEAKVADYNATTTRMEGLSKAEGIAREGASMAASQRAAAAASGRNPDVGSPSLVIADSAKNNTLDQLTTLWNSNTAAQNYEHQSAGLKVQADNTRRASKVAARGTFLSGLGSAAKGFGDAASTAASIRLRA
jgi:hypothetical protein